MTADAFVARVVEYFHASYRPTQISEMARFVSEMDDEDRDKLAEHIVQTREKLGALAVGEIRRACIDLGIGFRVRRAFDSHELKCPRCETWYTYIQAATDTDKAEGRHDRCPMCGFIGHYVFDAEAHADANAGKVPEWYKRELARDWKAVLKENHKTRWFDASAFRRELAEAKAAHLGIALSEKK